MTALNLFLYGMPLVLIAGGAVTLVFARRAAADIRSHSNPESLHSTILHRAEVSIENPNRNRKEPKVTEAA